MVEVRTNCERWLYPVSRLYAAYRKCSHAQWGCQKLLLPVERYDIDSVALCMLKELGRSRREG